MIKTSCTFAVLTLSFFPRTECAEDPAAKVKKAVERSTLDRSGTHPFHLEAEIARSFERDKGLRLRPSF